MSSVAFGGNAYDPAYQLQNELNINSSFDTSTDLVFGCVVVGCVLAMVYLKHSAHIGNDVCQVGHRLCQRTVAGVKACQNQLVNLLKGGRVVNNRAGAEQVCSSSVSADQVRINLMSADEVGSDLVSDEEGSDTSSFEMIDMTDAEV